MELRILGRLEVVRDGVPVEVGSPRLRSLLALLVVRGEVVSADRLIEDLWDGGPPETARHTLQGYVYRLRRALGPDGWRLESRPPGYQLKFAPDELDARRFQDLAERGRAAEAAGRAEAAAALLEEALALWRGPVLADLTDLVALEPERARLEGMRLSVLEDRMEADLAAGRHSGLVEVLEGLVSEHPFRERLWGQLMLALYRSGRQADALAMFRRARATLGEELGIEPSPGLCRLEERILLHHPDLDRPTAAALLDVSHNLPAQRTTFVGRRRELADLAGLLAARRLVTVTGPPGSGKTRLALEVADRAAPHHPHGVSFVSLAEIEEPYLVPSAIAATLGVSAPDRPILDALCDDLTARRLLLVLDNFEHLLPAATVVGQLLDAAPGLRVLVTSRVPLRLSGEQEYCVTPLPVPEPAELAAAVDPGSFDVLALFADRAKSVDPRFALTADEAALAAEVVARVDGLPLGVELAAARLRFLPLAELRDRLGSVLPLLTQGPTDRTARHRTLRDAIAWSYDLLDPADQALFRRLGTFRGGCTLEAAEAVATGAPVGDVMGGVSNLVEASLLRTSGDAGSVRYSMLDTVREYALEQLHAAGEDRTWARRHAELHAGLVKHAEPELTRAKQAQWLGRLDAEYDNLREVLRWALRTGDTDLGLVMAGRMWRFWHFRGRLTEGRSWLEDLLAAASEMPTLARAKALIGLAGLCYWQGDLDGAEAHYHEAIDVVGRRDREPDEVVDDRDLLGILLTPWWLEFESLLGLVATIACHRGDPDEAAPLEAQSQALAAQHPENMMAMGAGMATSALMRLFTGDLDGSREYNEMVLAGTRTIGERWYEAQTLRTLALISLRQEQYEQAESELRDALDIGWELGDLPSMAMDLDRLGQAAIGLGQPERAVTLAGAASRVRDTTGAGITIDDFRWETDHPRDVARRVLAEPEIDVAWAQGRSLSLEEALAYAEHAAEVGPGRRKVGTMASGRDDAQ